MGRDLFVGIGVDRYETGLPKLDHPVADVRAVAELFAGHFMGEPLLDAESTVVNDRLRSIEEQATGGALILMWSGHGSEDASGLRLATRDLVDEISAIEVVRKAIKAGASQTLFIIDTCQAGAVLNAAAMAGKLLDQSPRSGDHVWFGILVSCSSADIGARDDTFGRLLLKLLRKGPNSPDQVRRWSRHNRLILGEDLGQALLEEWTGDERPEFLRRGNAWYLVPNPLFEADAPEEVVEHLLRAARGGLQTDQRSWFTGRTQEVNNVVSWVTAGQCGVRVVTGSAGTGKSAIVGRVVCLSNPAERDRLEQAGRAGGHDDPGQDSVTAHVHARGLTSDRMADALDSQLVNAGAIPLHDAGGRNAAELVGALQRAAQNGATPPVLVIDGLDEARTQTFAIAEDLIARVAPFASVVVTTRPREREDGTQLLDVLNAVDMLDLDHPAAQKSGIAAIHAYVVDRLTNRDSQMNPTSIADELLGEFIPDRPFLLARVITDQLLAQPVNTTDPNWRTHIAHSTEAAFDTDIARVEQPQRHASQSDLARTMLTALTWGSGAGFPEDEWLAVASALAQNPLDRDDVSWVVEQLGRYIVQDGEDGVAVYRLAHQSLADHLRPPYQPTGSAPFDPAAIVVCAALIDRYAELLTTGMSAETPQYLWYYTWIHAANAGPDGLAVLRDLAQTELALRPDVALTATQVAMQAAAWGRRIEAVAPAEEAVALRREQAATNPAYLPDLAMALNNLGIRYSEVGRPADAIPLTEEAVTLRREQAADNPAYLPNLASALNNLTRHLTRVGNPADAECRWQDILGGLDESATSVVLLYRAMAAELGDPRAASWLYDVEQHGQRNLVGSAHDVARKSWRASPDEWGAAWVDASHGPLPSWLTVSPEMLALAEAWVATSTFEAEHDHLVQHPELLDETFDVAVSEALLGVEEQDADRYRELRAAARANGPDAAYRPLLLAALIGRFAVADPAQQQQLLDERRTDLLGEQAVNYLRHLVEQEDSDGSSELALALLELAHLEQDDLLSATFAAMSEPDQFTALLTSTTRERDSSAIHTVAGVALHAARTKAEAANAVFHLGVTMAIDGDEAAPSTVRQARAMDPNQTNTWIGQLAGYGAVHPTVLTLITVLTETDPDADQ